MFSELFEGAEVVSVYTRAQAIEDGVLVDVSETARQRGFKFPVAVTAAVWGDCIEWTEEDTARQNWPQDQGGRLWDVLNMAAFATRLPAAMLAEDRCRVTLYRVPRHGKARIELVDLVMVIGPGDDPAPVMTIMFPDED